MTDVHLTAPIYVNFSESMNLLSVNVGISPSVVLTPSWDMSGQSVFLDHAIEYTPYTWYTVTVTGNDLAGNPLDGNHDGTGGDPLIWMFRTGCGLCILSTDPKDGEENVGLNRPIIVTFSEVMNTATITVSIIPSVVIFSMIWTNGDTVLTMFHALFEMCTAYGVSIMYPGLNPGPVPNPWQFTTTGCAPVITGIAPPQVGAALDAPISVDFSTTMNNATVSWTLNRTLTLAPSWNADNTTLNLTHSVKFLPCTDYGFSITGKDMFGQVLDNGTFPMPYDFRTSCTFPTVLQTSPHRSEPDVALDAPINVTFSEPMDNKSVEESFSYNDEHPTFFNVTDGVASWNLDNTTFTFIPNAPYRKGITYSVHVNATAHGLGNNPLDGNGNGVADGRPADDYVWQFTAAQVSDNVPPTVESVSPAPNAMEVPKNTAITVTFSEAMNRPSVQDGIQVSDGRVAYGFTWPNNKTVNFNLIPILLPGTAYTITIANTVEDLVGNHMTYLYAWTFTTEFWRGDVHGRVVDDADDAPISNATVTLDGTQTLTDGDGNFTFTNVKQGPYLLNVMKEGYDSKSEWRNVTNGTGQSLGTIRLHKTQPAQSNAALIAVVGIIIFVVIVLLLLFLLSRRRRKVQPTKFEEWKGEVAEVERPDSGQ